MPICKEDGKYIPMLKMKQMSQRALGGCGSRAWCDCYYCDATGAHIQFPCAAFLSKPSLAAGSPERLDVQVFAAGWGGRRERP